MQQIMIRMMTEGQESKRMRSGQRFEIVESKQWRVTSRRQTEHAKRKPPEHQTVQVRLESIFKTCKPLERSLRHLQDDLFYETGYEDIIRASIKNAHRTTDRRDMTTIHCIT